MSQTTKAAGRVALVTGASRGIGRAIAVSLAREGFDVVVNYARNAAAADEAVKLIEAEGRRALPVQADVGSSDDRRRLVEQTYAWQGRLDLLVNNAGVAPDVRADLLDASEESFDRLISINVKGPYFLTQLVARQMIEQVEGSGFGVQGSVKSGGGVGTGGGGQVGNSSFSPKIVTIGSVSAYAASTNRGDYCVAKAGLSMMTRLYAARLAEFGINVYEVRPGVIETDMTGPVKAKYDKLIFEDGLTPIRRWGQGDDVARAVVAVASDLLPFSTGEVINVDGGFHMRRL